MIKPIIFAMALVVTPTVFANPYPPVPVVKLQNDTLYYQGALEQDSIDNLKKLYNNARTKPTVLEIDSPGGETTIGMDLGAFVADNDLSIRVLNMCFSSCANFVFPAGETTYVGKNAFIGWHGDGTSSDIYSEIAYGVTPEQSLREALIESYAQSGGKYTEKSLQKDIDFNIKYSRRIKAQEDVFYKKYNISPLLARYPHITEVGRQELETAPPNAMGWTYPPQILTQLGVKNIVLIDGTWGFAVENYDRQKPEFMGGTLQLIRKIAD